MDPEFTEVLSIRLTEIKREISELQNTIGSLFEQIETKQDQAQHIIHLLAAEGYSLNDQDLVTLGQFQVADVANELLDKSSDQVVVHYRALTETLQAEGILIPGKDPAANLLSHISRDERFVRVAPGTYGLKKWGLEQHKTKSRTRKRRK